MMASLLTWRVVKSSRHKMLDEKSKFVGSLSCGYVEFEVPAGSVPGDVSHWPSEGSLFICMSLLVINLVDVNDVQHVID